MGGKLKWCKVRWDTHRGGGKSQKVGGKKCWGEIEDGRFGESGGLLGC